MAWARQLQWREERITDVSLVRGLVAGISFFATTSVFLISGLVAMLSAAERISETMRHYPFFGEVSPEQVELKIGALLLLAISAFFKFTWSIRLHSYSTLMIGAMPEPSHRGSAEANAISDRLAEMSFLASKHYHGGTLAYYLGFSALTWFISAWVFLPTLALVILVILRRDYMSNAYRLAAGIPVSFEEGPRRTAPPSDP